MEITNINVQVEYLQALPGYSNVKFVAGAGAAIELGEDVKKCYGLLWQACNAEINTQVLEFKRKHESK